MWPECGSCSGRVCALGLGPGPGAEWGLHGARTWQGQHSGKLSWCYVKHKQVCKSVGGWPGFRASVVTLLCLRRCGGCVAGVWAAVEVSDLGPREVVRGH